MLFHETTELRGGHTGSRTHVHRKKSGIDFTGSHMAFTDDLCVNNALRVKGTAAVKAEAVGVSAVKAWVAIEAT